MSDIEGFDISFYENDTTDTKETKMAKSKKVLDEKNFYTTTIDNEEVIGLKTWGARDNVVRFMGATQMYDEAKFPMYRMKRVMTNVQEIINYIEDDEDYNDLVQFLQARWEEANKDALDKIRSTNTISFNHLSLYFKAGLELYVDGPNPFGGILEKVKYIHSFFGSSFSISLKVIEQMGDKVQPRIREVKIPSFEGVQSINDMPIRVITPEEKAALQKRGETFRNIAKGSHYLSYSGNLVRYLYFGYTQYKSDGRIMVDGSSFKRFDSSQSDKVEWKTSDLSGNSRGSEDNINITDDLLWICSPYVYGFSFKCKMWGQFDVDKITPISFRKDAIDKLVLDPELKSLILAVVKHNKDSFSDIIDGKGGGCMFLLHGEPGLGKTLTAEAVSESLERPLYSITIGELGTTPSEIEEQLRDLLELAGIWNAVVLLDEADIFLEKRTSGDIVRNAIVGIFLRLLEYHNGVLFMTSNRVNEFDQAFQSRISAIIRYPSMTLDTRVKIWTNLLEAAGASHLNPIELAAMVDLNGRQIKNVIRSALVLAKADNRQVSTDDIRRCMRLIASDDFTSNKKVGAVDGPC